MARTKKNKPGSAQQAAKAAAEAKAQEIANATPVQPMELIVPDLPAGRDDVPREESDGDEGQDEEEVQIGDTIYEDDVESEEDEKDAVEEELERLVFGDSVGFRDGLRNFNAAEGLSREGVAGLDEDEDEEGGLDDIADADVGQPLRVFAERSAVGGSADFCDAVAVLHGYWTFWKPSPDAGPRCGGLE